MNRVILRLRVMKILEKILYTGIYTEVLIVWRPVGLRGVTLGGRSDKVNIENSSRNNFPTSINQFRRVHMEEKKRPPQFCCI